MGKKEKKIQNIEFLRIIGCFAVILFHFFGNGHFINLFMDIEWINKVFKMTRHGYLAVELFFILAGIFFVLTLDTGMSLWEFVKKKLIRLYPVLIFLMIIYYILSLIGISHFKFYDNVLCLLLLNGTGVVLSQGNAAHFWYVSSMLWVLIPLFYCLKYFDKKVINIALYGLIFFAYTVLIHVKGGNMDIHTVVYGYFLNGSWLRAAGGIGTGYFIGEWYKNNIDWIKSCTVTLKRQLFLTVIEFMCLFFIIHNLFLRIFKYRNDFIFVAVFIVIILCFLFNNGFISKSLNIIPWSNISKYVYSFYLSHFLVLEILAKTVWKYELSVIHIHPVLNVVMTFVLIIIAGTFTYHFVEIPAKNYFTRKPNNIVT